MNNDIKVNTFKNMPNLREIEVETFEELKQLPMYVVTKAGHCYNKQEQLVLEDFKEYALLFPITNSWKNYIFIEKCTINNKKGVSVYLIDCYIANKKSIKNLYLGRPIGYITNDWEMYDGNKKFIEPKNRRWTLSSVQDIRFVNINTLDSYQNNIYPFGRLSRFQQKY